MTTAVVYPVQLKDKDPKNKLTVQELEANFASLVKQAKEVVPKGRVTEEEAKVFFKSEEEASKDSSIMPTDESA